jgi:hypothetical protein
MTTLPAGRLLVPIEPHDDFKGRPLAHADENAVREVQQPRCDGLELRYGAELHEFGVDDLSCVETLHDLRRRATDPGVLHIDVTPRLRSLE